MKDNINSGFEELTDKLGEWDAGDDIELPPPRGWLLGNVFARGFISSLFAEGGTGKTALRYAQLLSLATGNSLTGEHVFQRCRVLIVSLEDDANELRRRILAATLHHRINRCELQGWLFLAAPGAAAGKLMQLDAKGRIQRGDLADALESVVVNRRIDIISLDPFVKAHSVDENSNSAIDDVAQVLSDLAAKHDIAVDIPHHTRKGSADPGNAERGRGASAAKDRRPPGLHAHHYEHRGGESLRYRRRGTAAVRPHGQREGQHRAADGQGEMVPAGRRVARQCYGTLPAGRHRADHRALGAAGCLERPRRPCDQANRDLREMLNIDGRQEQEADDVSKLSDAELIQQLADTAKELGIEINLNYSFAQQGPAAEADNSPSVVETDKIDDADVAAGATFGVTDTHVIQSEFTGARPVRAARRRS